jgi:uncharacterized protein (TIGR00369 family)
MAERTLTVTWQDPHELAAAARDRTGLEFLRAVRDGELPRAPIQELLGFSLVEVEPGMVTFAMEPGEQHFNPIGVVHGGVAGTLLDSAMGACVHTTLELGQGYGTLQTAFHLVAPISERTGEIRAEGRVVHRGSRVATSEGRLLRASDGRVLAHGTSTCLIVQA